MNNVMSIYKFLSVQWPTQHLKSVESDRTTRKPKTKVDGRFIIEDMRAFGVRKRKKD